MKYDWIFFDLDNTLMDFEIASKKAFSSMLSSFGFKENEEHYSLYQQTNNEVWKDFENNKINAKTLRYKRFQDFYLIAKIKGIDPLESNKIYLEYLVEHSTMLEGAMPLLNELNENIKMAIITNGLKEVQRPRLKKLNIIHYFDAIIVSDEIGTSKPNSAYFDYVMKECSFPKKEKILVVGDSLNSDIKGGLNYGLDTCWCNLFDKKNDTDLIPHFEINQLSELKNILK